MAKPSASAVNHTTAYIQYTFGPSLITG